MLVATPQRLSDVRFLRPLASCAVSGPLQHARLLQTILRAGSDEQDDELETRLSDRVAAVWSNDAVRGMLEASEEILWGELDAAFIEWLQRRAAETVGQAFRAAVLAISPECSEDELELDVFWSPEGTDIYVTESSPGGVGHIERIVGAISSAPDRFEHAFGRALDVCPVDRVSRALRAVVGSAARGSADWLTILAQVRSATSFAEAGQARRELRTLLTQNQLDATRGAVVSIVNRVARPGTSSTTDRITHLVNTSWLRLERKLGIAIDASVFAYVLLSRDATRRRFEQALRDLAGGIDPSRAQIRSFLDQILIASCRDACRDCLDQPSRYDPRVRPDRVLAATLGLLPPVGSIGDVSDPSWRAELWKALAERGEASLRWSTDGEDLETLMAQLFSVLSESSDAGTIRLPVAITALEPEHGRWTLRVNARSAAR